jgi:uncharacterized integral membrane protein
LKPRLIVFLVVLLLALITIAQNAQYVTVRFLFWSAVTSQIVLVVLTLGLGFVMGFLLGKFAWKSRK